MRYLLLLASTLLLAPAPAAAGRGTPCDGCETCTALLAKPGAKAALSGPVSAADGPCVVIRGAGADFDGGRHTIKGSKVAVRIEADDVALRHVRAEGGEAGVQIAGVNATLLDVQVDGAKVGISVERVFGARIVRSKIIGGDVGIAFGLPTADRCPKGGILRSGGAVLQRVEVARSGVGVAACEAVPAISDSVLRANRIGLLQGEAQPPPEVRGPAARGAYDPCVCDPSLDGVKAGTTLFYSSGCGGCEIHEGFLPDVRERGHDVRLRKSGLDNKEAMATYDAYVRRCAPEITDAIGIPGCVPNYGCPSSGAVAKRRGDDDRLIRDVPLSGADDVAAFAAACASAGAAHFDGDRCPVNALRNTTVCHNKADIVSARAIPGSDNRCAQLDGAGDGVGCEACDGVELPAAPAPDLNALPVRPKAPAPIRQPKPAEAAAPIPVEPAPAAPAPTEAAPKPTEAAAAAPTPDEASAPDDEGPPVHPLVIVLILGLAAAGGAAFARRGKG